MQSNKTEVSAFCLCSQKTYMHQWQEIKIAESELSDLMDELSPVVDGAPRRAGWVAEWVLAGVLAELDWEFDSDPLEFEYVPQRRKYVRR